MAIIGLSCMSSSREIRVNKLLIHLMIISLCKSIETYFGSVCSQQPVKSIIYLNAILLKPAYQNPQSFLPQLLVTFSLHLLPPFVKCNCTYISFNNK